MGAIDENRMYTLREVAEITGAKQSNLTYWARRGQIQAKKAGRAWVISGKGVKHFIEHGTDERMVDGEALT